MNKRQKAKHTGSRIKRVRQWLSALTALMVVFGNFTIASGAERNVIPTVYQDTQTHWAKEAIQRWSDMEILKGYDGNFRPDDTMTRGELTVILNNIMKYKNPAENTFTDLQEAFYTEPMLFAYSAGIISDENKMVKPQEKLTRQQACVMIAKALGVESNLAEPITTFSDDENIQVQEKKYISGLQKRNIIHGDEGKFYPNRSLTRAEIVQILDSAIGSIYSESAVITSPMSNDVIINTPNIVLTDGTINGDIIITEGVGDGEVTLNNVTVLGCLIIRGGGSNSVKLNNSKVENISVEKKDGPVRVLSGKGSTVANTSIHTSSILEGNFISVKMLDKTDIAVRGNIDTLTASNAVDIRVESGKIEQCTLDTASVNSTVNISQNASVSTLNTSGKTAVTVNGELKNINIEKGSENTVINGTGKISQIAVNAGNVTIENKNANVIVGKNVTNVTVNGNAASSGSTVPPSKDSGSNSGGGGGGSDSSDNDSSSTNKEIKIVSVESIDAALIRVTLSKTTTTLLDKSAFSIICTGGGKDMTIVNVRTKDQKVYDISTAYYQQNTYNLEITLPNATRINKDFVVKLDCPEISSQSMKRTSTTEASFTYVSDMQGTFYYGISKKSLGRSVLPTDNEPTVEELVAIGTSLEMNQHMNTFKITGLEENVPYAMYYVAKDLKGNITPMRQFAIDAKPVDGPSVGDITILSVKAHEKFGEDSIFGYNVWFTIELSESTTIPLTIENFKLECPQGNLDLDKAVTTNNKTYEVYMPENTQPYSNNTYTISISLPDGTVVQTMYYLDLMAPMIKSVELKWLSETKLEATVDVDEEGTLYYKMLETTPDGIDPKDLTAIYSDGKAIPLSYGSNIITIESPTVGEWFCCATKDKLENQQQYYTYKKVMEYTPSEPTKPDELQIISVEFLSNTSVNVTFNKVLNLMEVNVSEITNITARGTYNVSSVGGKPDSDVFNISIGNGETMKPGDHTILIEVNNKYLRYSFTTQ